MVECRYCGKEMEPYGHDGDICKECLAIAVGIVVAFVMVYWLGKVSC